MKYEGKPQEYYGFKDVEKEVEFYRYDMPTPWMNYLSNGTMHAMISHAGGGVAFYKSPQIWRVNHYRFFHLPTDRSGFYTYIKDGEDIWCPTNMPVGTRPDSWKSSHGLGYTRFEAGKKGLTVTALYFIGKKENAMIWNLRFCSDRDRTIMVYPFLELGMMEFMRELQWQCYNKHQLKVTWMKEEQSLVYHYDVETQPKPDETPLIYFASTETVQSFEGDRDEFIGPYRSEENPIALEEDTLGNSVLQGGDPCFALQIPVELKAGEEKEMSIFLGAAMTENEIRRSLKNCRKKDFVRESFEELKETWNWYGSHFQCCVPDENVQRMVNIWDPYQAERNFLFSRNLSYYATGTFRGVGYRDTSQDILAIIPFDCSRAKEKIRLLLTQQYKDGHVNHYFFPTEGYEPVKTVHSDDHLWMIFTVWNLLCEEGNYDFLNEKIPYYDGESASVYEHLKQSISFTKNHLGKEGFPLMLRSDWNDALFRVCREGRGESIWTAMQYGFMLQKMEVIATAMGEETIAREYRMDYEEQKKLVNEKAWDGKWFRRAIMDNGEYLGRADAKEAKIWLNAQTWSVLSGMGDRKKCEQAMESVYTYLNTPMGIKKIDPPIVNFPDPKEPLTNYNPGTGENGSVFCHANTWAVIAECMLGHGDRAFEYYQKLIPSVAMETAGVWRYKAEPYVYASNIFGPDSLRFGLANVSWLTGTAAWMYLAVTQYILGIRPSMEGLILDPCLPSEWKEVKITRVFRDITYDIQIRQGSTVDESGGIWVNGELVKRLSKKEKSYLVSPPKTGKICKIEMVL